MDPARIDSRLLRPATAAAAVALILAASMTAVAPARSAAATPEPRAAIVFLPGPPPKVKPAMVDRLAQTRVLALGFMSSIMGSYSPEQVLLDMSAGSRTWTSLYDSDNPLPDGAMELVPRGRGGLITAWDVARERARTPPADIEPGTLAQAVLDGGGAVGYAGLELSPNREGIVATDRAGRVDRVVLAGRSSVAPAALRLWRRSDLLVAKLAGGREGAAGLSAILSARRPRDLVIVIQDPTGVARRLLAIGAAGFPGQGPGQGQPGGGRNLRSSSTRTDGLVVSTDIAPTVLERLGLPIPENVSGEPIEVRGDLSPAELSEMRDRLAQVGPRRWSVVLLSFAGAAFLAGLLCVATRSGLPGAGRCAFLAAVWLPSVLLLTGLLAPSRAGEIAVAAVATALLSLVTDRLLAWPRALLAPAAVTIASSLLDLALGSGLIGRSLFGPNPLLGARFYGVGNELEVTLAVIALLGLGAALATAPPRTAMWGFVVGGGLLAALLSWGRLGADVGASVMLAAGIAAAALLVGGERPGRGRIAIVLAAPVLALAALAALDLATGGDSHFTRSVLRAGGLGELADVAQRRIELSYTSLGKGLVGVLVAVAIATLVWAFRARRHLLAPLESTPGLKAGFQGAAVAVVVGAASNDSGPIILLIGTGYLALAAVYFRARPAGGKPAVGAREATAAIDSIGR